MKTSLKINLIYQGIVLLIGVILIVNSVLNDELLFVTLGGLLVIGALGTMVHILTGRHNTDSKLPKDIKVKY